MTEQCTGQNFDLDQVFVFGTGSSLVGEVYDSLNPVFESYRRPFVAVDKEYLASGSGVGKAAVADENGFLEYGASDAILTDEQYEQAPDLQMVPMLAG